MQNNIRCDTFKMRPHPLSPRPELLDPERSHEQPMITTTVCGSSVDHACAQDLSPNHTQKITP